MMGSLLSFWAATGIVLTSATQLRLGGFPVGPGELLLAGWMSFVGFLLLRGASFTAGRLVLFMFGYWMISAVLMAFGTLVGLNTHKLDVESATHDAVAFLFLVALSPMLALILSDHEGNAYHERLARHIFIVFTICTTSLLLLSHLVSGLGPLRLSYGGGARFLGWANNPNQMALFSCGMPFIGWFLLQRSRHTRSRIMYGIGIVCCVLVGLASASDGLRLSWAVGFGSAIGVAWWRAVLRMRGRFIYVTHLIVPFIIVSLGYAVLTLAWDKAWEVWREGGQGEGRIDVWTHGLQAFSESPLVGFGPGAYSGELGPFEGFEAHNSLIDWGNSTGLPGIILLVTLVIWCALRAWRAGSLIMLGMVIAMAVFGMFGYILRQPIYWVLLILAVRLPQQRKGARAFAEGRTRAAFTPAKAKAAFSAAEP
jgi:O-antigen ligase